MAPSNKSGDGTSQTARLRLIAQCEDALAHCLNRLITYLHKASSFNRLMLFYAVEDYSRAVLKVTRHASAYRLQKLLEQRLDDLTARDKQSWIEVLGWILKAISHLDKGNRQSELMQLFLGVKDAYSAHHPPIFTLAVTERKGDWCYIAIPKGDYPRWLELLASQPNLLSGQTDDPDWLHCNLV